MFGLHVAVSAQSVDTTKVERMVPLSQTVLVANATDTVLQGMTIIYHCNSTLPPDTLLTNHPGVSYIHINHGNVLEGPDPEVMEMKIKDVVVKVKY